MRLADKLYDTGFAVYTNTCFPIVCCGAYLPVTLIANYKC